MAEGCAFQSEVCALPNPTLDRSEPSPSHTRPRVSTSSSRLYSSMIVSDEVLRRHREEKRDYGAASGSADKRPRRKARLRVEGQKWTRRVIKE